MAQAEIPAAEAYPMRAIQSSLDFHLRTAKTRTNFFAWHAPVISIPADGVIVGYRASHAYAEDFFQPLLWIQPSMRIARVARCDAETSFPLRNKARLQKVIRGCYAVDPRQAHFFYQAVLQRCEQSLDASFGLRTVCRNPFDP